MAKSKALRQEKINLDEIIGLNIRAERLNREFTRDELAEMLDLTVSHMGLIERGERGATAVTLSKLSRVLDLPIDNFFIPQSKPALREERVDTKAALRKKINSIMLNLDEEKLAFVVHVIQGLNKRAPKK
ncbi:MAG: helix-turn-helix transcriptional regulator [Defluviitaleaceae bacterium]|nr:helix-turn-helix transcriptional regulator [Defluviitaleaceae bacterium]